MEIRIIPALAKFGFKKKHIANILGAHVSTVKYELDPDYREKKKKQIVNAIRKQTKRGENWKQKNREKYNEYMREYMRRRYYTF